MTLIYKLFARFALVVFAATMFAACGGSDAPVSEPTSILNRGTGAEPESLDSQKTQSVQAGDILRDLGEGLTGYSPTGELVPAAATAWELSQDGLTYRFSLRPEARWSNGDPLTAEDFVYSFRRLVDPDTAATYAEFVSDIVNAEAAVAGEAPPETIAVAATGPYELTIRLNNPVPYFPELLTNPATFPAHRASIEEHGDAHARPGNLVSNGAYKLSDWVVGSHIELLRNDNYWDNDNTSIDTVRHHVTPQPQVELNRYRAGELDITSNVSTEAFSRMQEERPSELRVSPALATYFYGFNLTRPPFRDNPNLRTALSMAIDREVIARTVVGRGEEPAFGFVPPGVNNYEARRLSYWDMSKDERETEARELYQEAGYSDENPLQVEIRYNTAESHKRIATTIQAMWHEVLGVETTLINEEFHVLLENINAAEVTEVFRTAWTGDYNDAYTFLKIMESDDPLNMPRYSNAEYNEQMDKAASQTNMMRRQIYMEEAERLLLADHAIMPIYYFVNKSMVSPRVQGWGDNVLNYHYSKHLSLAE